MTHRIEAAPYCVEGETIKDSVQRAGEVFKKQPDTRTAAGIAARAADLVGGDREKQHGAKSDNFARIATMWDAYMRIRREPAAPIDALDVGHFTVLMKLARTQSGSFNIDDYVDLVGYGACAGEVAQDAAAEADERTERAERLRKADRADEIAQQAIEGAGRVRSVRPKWSVKIEEALRGAKPGTLVEVPVDDLRALGK